MASVYGAVANKRRRGCSRTSSTRVGGRPAPQPPSGGGSSASGVAAQLTTMLQRVVGEGGTGTAAAIPGYNVAGKTGTAQKPDPRGGYSRTKYVASFVGFVPASEPAARRARLGRRARGDDLGRRRRRAGVRGDREVRAPVPRGAAGRPPGLGRPRGIALAKTPQAMSVWDRRPTHHPPPAQGGRVERKV